MWPVMHDKENNAETYCEPCNLSVALSLVVFVFAIIAMPLECPGKNGHLPKKGRTLDIE